MKLKFRAEAKDVIIFAIFSAVLFLLICIAISNVGTYISENTFSGLNIIPALTDYLTITILLFIIAIVAMFLSVQSWFIEREEGIGFAIPINNVLDIINDLKSYGYVTGKIDLGMELTDITSNESAFYYGVNKTGCYILSVTRGSNAESAGFRTGDIVTKVNDTNISTSADVKKALKDAKVGDTAEFTVYRSGKSVSISLKLEEYVPSGGKNSAQPATTPTNSDDSIWSQMFDW